MNIVLQGIHSLALRACMTSFLLICSASADDHPITYDESEILFARRIAPLLREKCIACHGEKPDEIEGGIDLRSLEALTAGGDSGDPGIVPGKPDESSIYLAAARGEEMFSAMPPKEAEQLSKEQLAWLHDWIKSGAKWPSKERQDAIHKQFANQWSVEDGITVKTSGGLSAEWTNRKYDPAGLWAYQPVDRRLLDRESAEENALVRGVKGDQQNPIDLLIEQALPDGLQVAPSASRRDLIRRATFDLTGLPPTPKEVSEFVGDNRPNDVAFAAVVDRLMESPHYGERMAQHWLDVVRYADSSGFANDYERGSAWRYRDYVVRSFNADKPYDQFVREQIAGDEINPDDPEGLVAVGFLRMGPWELTGMEVAKIARQRFLDDVTNSVGETFLGHSLQCARCHDHKFDPVPTQDYYRIQAVFATTQLADRKAEFLTDENTSGFDEQAYLQRIQQEHGRTLKQLDEVLLKNADAWYAENDRNPAEWNEAVRKARKSDPYKGVFKAARNSLMQSGVKQEAVPPVNVGFTPEQFGRQRVASKGRERLKWEFDRYRPFALSVYNGHTPNQTAVTSPQRVPKDRMKGELEASCILTGGDPFASGTPVTPGTLSVIDDQVSAEIPTDIEGRRAKFADWVTSPDNPLTTRVIVNRVWQWHFGKAIAGNPNNFGSTGGRPTHPKLLDFLASTFVDEGWSIKALHRRIMLSGAYQRGASHPDPGQLTQLDPLGTSWAVFHPRRLTAEELRDSMLAVTGELNPTLGGIPCRPEINVEVAMQPRQVMGTFASAWVPNPRPEQRHRRSIYSLKLRGMLHPMLEVFNSPAPDFSCERREASTVTPQVFSLFNGQNSYSRALAMADRAWRDVSDSPADQRDMAALNRCIELAFGREATSEETDLFLDHWEKLESQLPATARPSPHVPLTVKREAVEENTGEHFAFEEQLFSNKEFVPDLQPSAVDRHVRALGDVCLVILNSNEFVYVY